MNKNQKMRKNWIDNLRWVTVLSVLLYHVIYFFNNKGVFWGLGWFWTFPEYQQYQDVIMYILYPWFMPLLFLLAGISARYSLKKYSNKEWFKSRTRKLLVPSTIGLFVFQWMLGYFNTEISVVAQGLDRSSSLPWIVKYFVYVMSWLGHLWFIQLLWLLCIALLLIRKIDYKDKFRKLCRKSNIIIILWLGILFRLGTKTLIFDVTHPLAWLYNLYKPFFYLIIFLIGYLVFSHDEVQQKVKKIWIPLLTWSILSWIILIYTTWGENNSTPQYLSTRLCCIYGWITCLALMGWFNACFDWTNKFSNYMTHSSYGIYIVHYLIIAALGYMMKMYTQLSPLTIYLILTVAVFTLSPLLYEILHHIPIIRWCVLWEKALKK